MNILLMLKLKWVMSNPSFILYYSYHRIYTVVVQLYLIVEFDSIIG